MPTNYPLWFLRDLMIADNHHQALQHNALRCKKQSLHSRHTPKELKSTKKQHKLLQTGYPMWYIRIRIQNTNPSRDKMKQNTHLQNADYLRTMLYAYALRLTCGNTTLAKELLQETMSRITVNPTAYPSSITSFQAWARIVMQSTFHQTIEDADRRELYHLFYRGTLNPFTPPCDKAHTLREQIRIMARLTPHQAAATTLRLNGYSHNVIAKEMGISIESVKEHLFQARLAITRTWGN